jgi:hypothetical protein
MQSRISRLSSAGQPAITPWNAFSEIATPCRVSCLSFGKKKWRTAAFSSEEEQGNLQFPKLSTVSVGEHRSNADGGRRRGRLLFFFSDDADDSAAVVVVV